MFEKRSLSGSVEFLLCKGQQKRAKSGPFLRRQDAKKAAEAETAAADA